MSRQRTLVLLGGGGHGAVVAEAARAGGWLVVGFLDDDEHHPRTEQVNLKHLGAIEDLANVLASLPKWTAAYAAVGIGRPAHADDLVTINYRVRLANGREILRDRDYRFELGRSTVITAIDEAVQGMREHGRRTVESPPNKHWGRAGYGNGAIPPNVTLTIDIELLAID